MSITSVSLESPPSDATNARDVITFPIEHPRLKVRRNLRTRDRRSSGPAIKRPSLAYFALGPENRLASYLATSGDGLLEVAQPVLLVGGSGTGKSTLALHYAARHAIRHPEDGKPAVVHYLTATDFARQYAEAVAADDLLPLQEELDEVPVLVLDDLHLIHDKRAAQEELSRRLELRVERNRLTLLTCRRLPSDTRGLRPRLVSRVLSGLTVPLVAPGSDTRRMLLRELALLHGIDVGSDLLEILETGLPQDASARQLEASLKQAELFARMSGDGLDTAAVQQTLDHVHQDNELSIAAITRAVARYFRLKASELRSSSRRQNIVRARSLAMLLSRKLTSLSLHQIGEEFGGRDHSTVLHALRKTESQLVDDAVLRRALAEVSEKLTEAGGG